MTSEREHTQNLPTRHIQKEADDVGIPFSLDLQPLRAVSAFDSSIGSETGPPEIPRGGTVHLSGENGAL